MCLYLFIFLLLWCCVCIKIYKVIWFLKFWWQFRIIIQLVECSLCFNTWYDPYIGYRVKIYECWGGSIIYFNSWKLPHIKTQSRYPKWDCPCARSIVPVTPCYVREGTVQLAWLCSCYEWWWFMYIFDNVLYPAFPLLYSFSGRVCRARAWCRVGYSHFLKLILFYTLSPFFCGLK